MKSLTVKNATPQRPVPVGTVICENDHGRRTLSQPKRQMNNTEVMIISTVTTKVEQTAARKDDETTWLLISMRLIPVDLEHQDVAFDSPARTTMVIRLRASATRSTANADMRIDDRPVHAIMGVAVGGIHYWSAHFITEIPSLASAIVAPVPKPICAGQSNRRNCA